MQELFFFLSVFFMFVLFVVAWQDYRNKLIYLWSFYLLNLVGLIWVWFFGNGVFFSLMLIYFFVLLIFEILDLVDRRPAFLTKDWMIGNTGFYDYWFYIFLIGIFLSYLGKDFLKVYIFFSLSICIGVVLAFLLTKKKYSKGVPLFVYAFLIILFLLLSIYLLKLY